MRLFKRTTLSALALLSASYASNAEVVWNQTVGLAGGNPNYVFVEISPNPDECLWGGVVFDNAKFKDNALEIALSAKANSKLVRVDYVKNETTGQCRGFGIYIQ